MAQAIGTIIKKARLEKGWSQTRLAKEINKILGTRLTKGAVSAWEKRNVIPKPKNAPGVAMALNIPLHWIAGDPSGANVVPITDGGQKRLIPKIDWVCAVRGAAAVDPYPKGVGVEYIEVSARRSADSFALEIRGNSMEPKFHEGDTIVVDPAQIMNLKRDDFVIVELLPHGTPEGQGNVLFRQYAPRGSSLNGEPVFDLVALNTDEPTITVHKGNPGRIVGKVVEHHENL